MELYQKRALVTIAYGDLYLDLFRTYCLKNWQQYGALYNYDIIVFKELPDTSERAQSRSPAWQKCLVGEHPIVQGYDQVVWLDADIIINPLASPSVCYGVPLDKVGAVDDRQFPTAGLHLDVQHRIQTIYGTSDFETRYRRRGLPKEHAHDVQTGMLVFNPQLHQSLFRHVYDTYEDLGKASFNYEMYFLSHELLERNLLHWVDPRFNATFWYEGLLHYPFLLDKVAAAVGVEGNESLQMVVVSNVVSLNYFTHFAGTQPFMKYADAMTIADFSRDLKLPGCYQSELIVIG